MKTRGGKWYLQNLGTRKLFTRSQNIDSLCEESCLYCIYFSVKSCIFWSRAWIRKQESLVLPFITLKTGIPYRNFQYYINKIQSQQILIFLTRTLQTSYEEVSNYYFLWISTTFFSRTVRHTTPNDFFFSDGLHKFTQHFVKTYSTIKLISQTQHTSLKDCSFFGRRCFGFALHKS